MSEPKRVLVLVTSLDRGGIETMIMNYYRRMDRDKWQFDFLVNREQKGAYEEEILRLGGRIFRMGGMYPWRYLAYRREFLRFLREHPEYSVIHSHLEERSYWPLKLAKRAGVPVRICHAHNVYPFGVLDAKGYFRQWFRKGVRRKGVATDLLACSRYAGEWLYGKGADFQIITNAIDFAELKFDARARAKVRRELGIGENVCVVGFVGRLVAQKNPEFALEVFAGVADREEWRMIFVGKGELRSRLQKMSRGMGMRKKVFLAGEVSDVAEYYSAFDVLLMPSLHEGLGLVAVEAGASGLPVIASDNVPPEANVVKNTKFLGLGEMDKWRKAVQEIEVGRRWEVKITGDVKEYDISVAVKKLEKLYEDITY